MATANNLGTAYIRIAPQMKGIQSVISSSFGSAGGKAAASFSSSFASRWGKAAGVVAGVAATAVSKAIGSITDTLDMAISRTDTLNAFPKIMKNLGFEAAESTSALQKLSDRIEGLPTTLDGIVTYTQRLASSMGNLNKGMYNATNLAIAFNDAALAGGKGQYEANRAFEQFAQVISRSRPSMQDWKILMEVMPGQLKQIAKYMGHNNKDLKIYAKEAKKTVDQLDGMDLYAWISEDKNFYAKERLAELSKAMIDLDNKGGAGITSFKDQVGDATHTIGNALGLIKVRIGKALASIIQAFGASDIYTTVDKFTSSFKKVGDWAIKYVVPPIKEEVLPALKSILDAAKILVRFIAQNEWVRTTIGRTLQAILAWKALSAVGSTVMAVSRNVSTFFTTVKGVGGAASTFLTFFSASGSVNTALMNTAANTTGTTSALAALGAKLTSTVSIAGVSVTAFAALAGVLGAVILVAGSFALAMSQQASNEEHARIQTELHNRSLVTKDNLMRQINDATKLQTDLTNDLAQAEAAQEDDELAVLLAKKRVLQLRKEYNDMLKSSTASADDLRIKQLELRAAERNLTSAEDKLAKSKQNVASKTEEANGAILSELHARNRAIGLESLEAKNYGQLARQLVDLSKKTITYTDVHGKQATMSKKQVEEISMWYAEALAKNDKTWASIVKLAKEKGISLTEATAQAGKKAGDKLVGNFDVSMTTGFPKMMTKMPKLASSQIAKAFSSIGNSFSGIGRKLGSRLGAGITEGIELLMLRIKRTGNNFVEIFNNALRKTGLIHSPSRLTMKTGRYLAEGLLVGMEQQEKNLELVANRLMNTTLGALSGSADPTIVGLNGTYGANGANGAMAVTPSQTQVIQNNTFNQVDSTLDVKEASRLLGWQVATSI